ncbi:uncharacterized protein LOC127251553 [Andrographis paniculata]|uniref:uncharacterized protein LOC127251553 n=1 Tax=Andrographis paniculata TaxID=175694 RepID=UPI0021E874A0|nr:uncharacterized protein LOC127251553 [Andrographis paniculata]
MGPSSGHHYPDDVNLKVMMGYPAASRDYSHHHHHAPPPPQFQSPHSGTYVYNAYGQPMTNDDYYKFEEAERERRAASVRRLVLLLAVILFCGMMVAAWLLCTVYAPEFSVASLKVSNFSATNTSLTGTWEAELSIHNWDKGITVQFNSVVSSLFYQEALLAMESPPSFQVPQMERYALKFNLSVLNNGDSGLNATVPPGLLQELDTGTVVFGLRVAMEAVFQTSGGVLSRDHIQIFCGNMAIVFSSHDQGSLAPGLGNTCLMSIHRE